MGNQPARGTFHVGDIPPNMGAEVLSESRTISSNAGKFADDFDAYAVHLYHVRSQ
jgi:hypothetical protein